MAVNKNTVIEVSESSSGKLCIYWDEFRGNRFLHLRYWYRDKSTGEYKPGVKGIAIPENSIEPALLGIKKVLALGEQEEDGHEESPYAS